jgi:hypothetical protein
MLNHSILIVFKNISFKNFNPEPITETQIIQTVNTTNKVKNKTNSKIEKFYKIATKPFSENLISGDNVCMEKNSKNYLRHCFPKRSIECPECSALMWKEEKIPDSTKTVNKFSLCCMKGKIKIPNPDPSPNQILELLKQKEFKNHIRLYNSLLSFTSMNCILNKDTLLE